MVKGLKILLVLILEVRGALISVPPNNLWGKGVSGFINPKY
jgi:hypothetical protein